MSLKFKPIVREIKIPWKEGAVLKFEFIPYVKRIKMAVKDKDLTAVEVMESSLVGWEGIVDEAGKPLDFNDGTKSQIFEQAYLDDKMQEKIFTAYQGPVPN